jgi:hypothetical protein
LIHPPLHHPFVRSQKNDPMKGKGARVVTVTRRVKEKIVTRFDASGAPAELVQIDNVQQVKKRVGRHSKSGMHRVMWRLAHMGKPLAKSEGQRKLKKQLVKPVAPNEEPNDIESMEKAKAARKEREDRFKAKVAMIPQINEAMDREAKQRQEKLSEPPQPSPAARPIQRPLSKLKGRTPSPSRTPYQSFSPLNSPAASPMAVEFSPVPPTPEPEPRPAPIALPQLSHDLLQISHALQPPAWMTHPAMQYGSFGSAWC